MQECILLNQYPNYQLTGEQNNIIQSKMSHCLSNRNYIVWRHFTCYTWSLQETTLSVHIKASALQTSRPHVAASGSKVFSGTNLGPS